MTEAQLQRDPFGDDIVTSPRTIERAVGTLNAEALDRLVASFGRVAEARAPRLDRNQSAVLMLSPGAGYGKSHLIGRLFRALDDRATLLYLRPFQDPSSCWVSLLDKVVVELDHPDAAHKLQADPGEPTQLDTLVRRVLGAVMTKLLQDDRLRHPDKEGALEVFRKFPRTALEDPVWRNWLASEQDSVLKGLDGLLREQGIDVRPTRRAWLKVLLAYAYSEEDEQLRQLCLDWITYRPLDRDEGEALGLRLAEVPETDVPYEQRNEKCFERLSDLFTIGAFYRPFLLCFDQTELYGASAPLARSFGVVVSRLRRETCNHLVVVTANGGVWQERVHRHFEVADQHAFSTQPIELEGMNEDQAEELLRNRFAAWEIGDDADQFCRKVLPRVFKEHARRGVRDVLRAARNYWGAAPSPEPKAIFESYRLKLLAEPKGLAYDPGVIQWAVENVLGPAIETRVEQVRSPKGYFTVQWGDQEAKRRELFGFERGNHWKRWDAIVREAKAYHLDSAENERVRASFFRFPNQKPLSERTCRALDENEAAVRLVNLELDQAADLFAAHDFVADVQQGNQDLNEEEVLAFLQGSLRELAEQVWFVKRSTTRPPPPSAPLAELITATVRAKRFVTLQLLRAQLPPEHRETPDAELVKAAATIGSIKVHISPGNKVFQWLQSG